MNRRDFIALASASAAVAVLPIPARSTALAVRPWGPESFIASMWNSRLVGWTGCFSENAIIRDCWFEDCDLWFDAQPKLRGDNRFVNCRMGGPGTRNGGILVYAPHLPTL